MPEQATVLDDRDELLWLRIPAHFTEFALDSMPDHAVLKQRAQDAFPEAEEAHHELAASATFELARMLHGIGAVYAGSTVLREHETIAVAILVVSIHDIHSADGEVVIRGLLEALTADQGQSGSSEGRRIELPCGPAAAVISAYDIYSAQQEADQPAQEKLGLRQIQILVPHVAKEKLITLLLISSADERWPEVTRLMAEVSRSLSFEELNEENSVDTDSAQEAESAEN